MRKIVAIATVLLLASTIGATEISKYAKDSLDGFRGFLWGDQKEAMSKTFDFGDPVETALGGREKFYQVDIGKIGDAEIDKCAFVFFDDLFEGVMLSTKRFDNWALLYAAVGAKYGHESQENRYIKEYTWNSGKSYRSGKLNSISKDGSFMFMSLAILNERREAEKKGAEKAKDDL